MAITTHLDPWSARLLAIVAAAPLLHCGGISQRGSDSSEPGATSGSGGTLSESGGMSSTGSGGFVSAGSGGTTGGLASGGFGAVSGTTGAAGEPGMGRFPCRSPEPPLLPYDSGYEWCGDFMHRPRVVECVSTLPRDEWEPGEYDRCTSDAECAEALPRGYCDVDPYGSTLGLVCLEGCTTDADCGEGRICACGAVSGTCVKATCTTDADCGSGLLCASVLFNCSQQGFACQHPDDECAHAGDCSGGECLRDEDGVRRCTFDCNPAIGRPFLVAEETRIAVSTARKDWKACQLSLEARHLSEPERAALGAAWLKNALMEHASVAAFARFTLELLAVGAPAELIRDSNAAASDETRHAELCFALASEYLGEPVGPGPLRVDGALDGISLEKLLVTAIAEGCIGETVAAVEAAEQLAHASDPLVRSVLSRISDDETRHAELAWRFVVWALEQQPSLRALAEREFERHSSAPSSFSDESELDLGRHGVLAGRTRAELRRRVLGEVIRPCAARLLARPAHFAHASLQWLEPSVSGAVSEEPRRSY